MTGGEWDAVERAAAAVSVRDSVAGKLGRDHDWDESDWDVVNRNRKSALDAIDELVTHVDDLGAIRAARAALLPPLDALMDEPAFLDVHGLASRLLDKLAEIHGAPDLRLNGRY